MNGKNLLMDEHGFTLIELMVVVAIIGVLAAVAVPNYTDYMVRAKVSEGVVFLSNAAKAASAYYNANNAFPTDAREIFGTNGGAVAAWAQDHDKNGPTWVAGGIDTSCWSYTGTGGGQVCSKLQIFFNVAKIPQLIGPYYGSSGHAGVEFQGVPNPDGSIKWTCQSVSSVWGVDPRYLPNNCR